MGRDLSTVGKGFRYSHRWPCIPNAGWNTWTTSYMELHIPAIATPIFWWMPPSSLDFSYPGYHIKQLLSRSSLKVFPTSLSSNSPESLSLLYTSRTPKYLQYEGFYSPLCCDVRCLCSSNACEGGHRKGRGMSSDYYMWLQETELTERNVDRLWVINLTFRSEAATRRQDWLRGDMNRM